MRKRSIVIATVTVTLIASQILGCGGLWSMLLSGNGTSQTTSGGTTGNGGTGTSGGGTTLLPTGTSTAQREDAYGFGSVQVGDYVYFGNYEQDNDLTNGTEPIQWKVMAVEDGRALLMSVYSLEYRQFHHESIPVTWEESDLRSWMNNDFYDSAFTEEEKDWIQLSTLENPDSPYYGTEGGNTTEDYVFTVSLEEIQQYFPLAYSNEYSTEEWFAYSEDLQCEATPYALEMDKTANPEYYAYPADYLERYWDSTLENYYSKRFGVTLTWDMLEGKQYDDWWTRTPGQYDESDPEHLIYCRSYVYDLGHAGYGRGHSEIDEVATRVFVWVDTK